MRVKLHRVIKIGAYRCQLSRCSHLTVDEGTQGYFNRRTLEIKLSGELRDTQLDTVFMHEVIHQIDEDKRIGLDEKQTMQLANGFVELLKRNFGIEFDWSDIEVIE